MVQEALKEFFGERLSADWAGECLGDLVQNPANVNLVVDIAVEYTDAMGGWEKVLAVLEKAPNASQVEFAYLARRIATSEEPEEHYRYIVAASQCQQFQVRWSLGGLGPEWPPDLILAALCMATMHILSRMYPLPT